jgi:hypothetical protein
VYAECISIQLSGRVGYNLISGVGNSLKKKPGRRFALGSLSGLGSVAAQAGCRSIRAGCRNIRHELSPEVSYAQEISVKGGVFLPSHLPASISPLRNDEMGSAFTFTYCPRQHKTPGSSIFYPPHPFPNSFFAAPFRPRGATN